LADVSFQLHLLDGDTAYCASDYPVFLSHGDPTSHSRQFLDHPLSIESDVRLVASVELMTQICEREQAEMRWRRLTTPPAVIHQQLCVTLNGPSWEEIEHLCKNIVGWEKYWDKVMGELEHRTPS
jgi:hypothetical protein